MKTQIIDGYEVTLKEGHRYVASRPMACRGFARYFPITIKNADNEVVATLKWLSYEGANDFLSEFNNGASTYDGRVW